MSTQGDSLEDVCCPQVNASKPTYTACLISENSGQKKKQLASPGKRVRRIYIYTYTGGRWVARGPIGSLLLL